MPTPEDFACLRAAIVRHDTLSSEEAKTGVAAYELFDLEDELGLYLDVLRWAVRVYFEPGDPLS